MTVKYYLHFSSFMIYLGTKFTFTCTFTHTLLIFVASLSSFIHQFLSAVKTWINYKGSSGAKWRPYFSRLRLWPSRPKTYTDRQWEDSTMTSHLNWAPLGSVEVMLPSLQTPAPGSLDQTAKERVSSVCVCVCRLGGRRSLGKWIRHLVQPPAPLLTDIASARPKGQLSPFLAFLSLLAISRYLPHHARQRWMRSYFTYIWETVVTAIYISMYIIAPKFRVN